MSGVGREYRFMKNQTIKTPREAKKVEAVITTALATLSDNNPDAYKILCTINQEGFFEKPQTKVSIKQIANRLLDTIQSGAVEDES